jgi:acyl carrier protein
VSRRDQVREIVARALAEAGDPDAFTDSASLIVTGRLGSLDVVNILLELEETFGLEIGADDFDPMRFDTVDSIVELLG